MDKRFVSIWFRHLKTDWMIHHQPALKQLPFVLIVADHGRMRITEVSVPAKVSGIQNGMVVADARVILPTVQVMDDEPELAEKILKKIGAWCIRFTPIVALDGCDGLILDITGCAHLWGTEEIYLRNIISRLRGFGYHVRAAMADTIGTAWAVCRYGTIKAIIKPGEQEEALLPLPPAALRVEVEVLERLHKLGMYRVHDFISIPSTALHRRFGEPLLHRLNQATGKEEEWIDPLQPVEPYQEWLPCMEPIQTATGIEIALQRLLDILCNRLQQEAKGLRIAVFKGYRMDGKTEQIAISTNHASNNAMHLFKLLALKITTIEPALGIELFTIEASKVEIIKPLQETFWVATSSLESKEVGELVDRLESKFGNNIAHRYLPDAHHIPERSVKLAGSLQEQAVTPWQRSKLRPIQLLREPQPVQVTAPIPDYPPMNFRYNGRLHTIRKADGCERIAPEWWLDGELHRDYYSVEDEEGKRYWLFRAGHYDSCKAPCWFIHGFFA